jgi:methylmalonyl-CoA mutase
MSAPDAHPPQPAPAQPDPQIAAGIDLARWFPPADPAAWRAAAQAALKGKAWDKVMELELPGGQRAPALATAPALSATEALAVSRLCRRGPWERLSELSLGAVDEDDALGAAIADELTRGASSVGLADPGGQGWAGPRLVRLLAAAPLAGKGLWLDARHDAEGALAALEALSAARPAERWWGGALVDPWGPLLAGEAASPSPAHDGLARALQQGFDRARFLLSGLPWAEAGAPPAWELAGLLAAALDSLRALADRGVAAPHALGYVRLQLGLSGELVVDLAKLRALRRLWAKLGLALGLSPEASRADLHARQLDRGLCAYDLHSNALRATVAGLGGAAGGADGISLRPYDAPLRSGLPAARRLALHTHLLLEEEGHLGALDDLAGGAYSVEGLAAGLCAEAWALLQRIEAAGGLSAALTAGWPQAEVGAAAARLQVEVDKRQRTLVGLSEFAWAGEQRPPARAALRAPAVAGGPAPLRPLRLAAPWEALRDTAGATPPTLFLACIGPVARHAARAGFAEGLALAGGLRPVRPSMAWPPSTRVEGPAAPDERAALQTLAEDARAQNAAAAIICGDEADTAHLALPLAAALRPLPVWVAGRPGADAEALRAAGVVGFVHVGAPLASALAELHARLGAAISPEVR